MCWVQQLQKLFWEVAVSVCQKDFGRTRQNSGHTPVFGIKSITRSECMQDRPHTVVSFTASTPPHPPWSSLPPHYIRNLCVCASSLLIMSDFWFPVCFLFSFIAFYLQHSSEGCWEIALKWFIIGWPLPHAYIFVPASVCTREGRANGGGGRGVQISCFNFSIGSWPGVKGWLSTTSLTR